jgi:integrase
MITKIVVRPYKKAPDQLEADVFMLVSGKEVRRRWRSPMPSKLATERWAREKAKALLAELVASPTPVDEEEEDEEVEAPEPAAPLFKEFAARWLDEYVIANRHSPATVEGRQKCLRTHLLPLLGDLRLDAIGAAQYQKVRAARASLDVNTVNKICDQLSTMLRVAADWKLIPAPPKVKRLKPEPREMPALTPEQGEALVETARRYGAKFYLVALLGVDGGLRNSEIIGLRWSDIDFEAGEIVVQNRVWNGQQGPPKHQKIRHVPLTERLREALRAFPQTAEHVLRLARDRVDRRVVRLAVKIL